MFSDFNFSTPSAHLAVILSILLAMPAGTALGAQAAQGQVEVQAQAQPQATPPPATPAGSIRIKVLEGDGAINNIREGRAKEPVIQVEDDDGGLIKGAPVTFQLPAMGASGMFTDGKTSITAFTDNKGQAVGRGLRPNNIAGQFVIQVSVSYLGETARTTITQTNAAPAGGKPGSSAKYVLIGILVAGAAAGAAVAGKGGGSKSVVSSAPTPTAPPGTVVTPGTGTFGPPQ